MIQFCNGARRGVVLCGLVLQVAALTVSVQAQTASYRAPRDSDGPLRWKFTKGQVFKTATEQKTTMSITIGSQPIQTANQNINEMTLEVTEVDSDGTAQVAATLDRMSMEMESNGQKMRFDTADKNPTTGAMAEVAKLIQPMIGKKITQDMSASGKVSNVNVPEDMLPTNANPMIGGLMNKRSLEEMSSRGSLEFPEANLEVGHTWQVKAELEMGPAKILTTTDYKYLGVKEGQDGPLHVIEGKISMSFPQAVAGSTVEIVKEDSTVTFFFDGVKGHMHGTELFQDMKMRMSAAGQSSDQHIVQTMKATFEEKTASSDNE